MQFARGGFGGVCAAVRQGGRRAAGRRRGRGGGAAPGAAAAAAQPAPAQGAEPDQSRLPPARAAFCTSPHVKRDRRIPASASCDSRPSLPLHRLLYCLALSLQIKKRQAQCVLKRGMCDNAADVPARGRAGPQALLRLRLRPGAGRALAVAGQRRARLRQPPGHRGPPLWCAPGVGSGHGAAWRGPAVPARLRPPMRWLRQVMLAGLQRAVRLRVSIVEPASAAAAGRFHHL